MSSLSQHLAATPTDQWAPADGPATGRIHSLDGLRAFSIALVIVGHVAGTSGSPAALAAFHSLGNYGVRFFFVISGFLITYLLLREIERTGSIDLKAFMVRRALRIFPALYVYIAVGALLAALGFVDLRPGDLLHAATFTMNFHEDRAWHFNHIWSLSVEEQFYLVWPLSLLVLGRLGAVRALMLVLVLVPVIRTFMLLELGMSESAMTRHFQAVADSLSLGCLIAFLYRAPSPRWLLGSPGRTLLWAASAGALLLSAASYKVDPALFYTVGQTLANLGAGGVVYLCITADGGAIRRILNYPLIAKIGVLSYSLYLWQEPFLNSYETGWLQSFPQNIALTFAAAWLSYRLVERPFLALKPPRLAAFGRAR